MAEYTLNLPINDEQTEKLEIGDVIYLNGMVYTARDMAHLEISRLLKQNAALPVELSGQAIFHAGPVALKKDEEWDLIVIGPTTSIRMEPYADMVGRLNVKLIIGKGGMSADSLQAFQKYKQVYLQAAPGCAVQLAQHGRIVKGDWIENGIPEAMWSLKVEKFGPFIVTMDSRGNSRYEEVKIKARQVIAQLYD
jgi:fumarate hydratase subunit beta/L(+)-tartrate dehydratase beta subunit